MLLCLKVKVTDSVDLWYRPWHCHAWWA